MPIEILLMGKVLWIFKNPNRISVRRLTVPRWLKLNNAIEYLLIHASYICKICIRIFRNSSKILQNHFFFHLQERKFAFNNVRPIAWPNWQVRRRTNCKTVKQCRIIFKMAPNTKDCRCRQLLKSSLLRFSFVTFR